VRCVWEGAGRSVRPVSAIDIWSVPVQIKRETLMAVCTWQVSVPPIDLSIPLAREIAVSSHGHDLVRGIRLLLGVRAACRCTGRSTP
jgi:hypothetical protein